MYFTLEFDYTAIRFRFTRSVGDGTRYISSYSRFTEYLLMNWRCMPGTPVQVTLLMGERRFRDGLWSTP